MKMKDRVCQIEGCNKKVSRRYLCPKHYREERNGSLFCKVEDCKNLVYERGYCKKHYLENKYKDITCKVVGCYNKVYYGDGYCHKHHEHMLKWGEVRKTAYEEPDIIDKGEYVIIKLMTQDGNESGDVLIDKQDLNVLTTHKIKIEHKRFKRCYICSKETGKNSNLPRFIMKPSNDSVIDHINHNTLDNRRINLRICTNGENSLNKKVRIDSTMSSRYKGVTKRRDKWIARIGVDYKRINLGYFHSEKEAAEAYNIAAIKYHGEFACLNKVLRFTLPKRWAS